MLKRIIQVIMLLGLAVYGREAFAQTTTTYTVQKGDIASRIALRYTERASNWAKPWLKITSPKGQNRANKNRIYPGDQVFIDMNQVKAEPVAVSNQTLPEICSQYVNADCVKRLSGINEIKNPAAKITGQIYIPKDFQLKPVAAKPAPMPAQPISAPMSNWTIFGIVGVIALVIIGILTFDSIALLIQRLHSTKIQTPRLPALTIGNPSSWMKRAHKLEVLAAKLRNRLELAGKTAKNRIEISPFTCQVIYACYNCGPPVDQVFSQMIRDYEELAGELTVITRDSPYFQTPKSEFAIRWKKLDRWDPSYIEMAELRARMTADGRLFFEEFKKPIANSIKDPIDCDIEPVPLREKLIIRLFPKEKGAFEPSLRGPNAAHGVKQALKKIPHYNLESMEERDNSTLTITLVLLEETTANEHRNAS